MLVHFDSNLSFNSTCIKRGKRTLLYGREYALELDCVYGDEDTPLDIQALGCESWRLSIYKSHSTPSELLLRKDYAENMAVGNRIIIDFATTTRPMYEYMAGSPCAPILFELYGYNDGESLPTVSLQFLMTMRTTATYVQPRPVRDNANDGVLTLINGDTYTQFSANSASDVTVDVTPKMNAYADLSEELLPYLYAADYTTLDYKYAYSWFAQYNEAAPVGACSSIRSGGFFGRNYDWVYSEMAEFIVSTHAAPGRHAVVGMANAKDMLTRSIVESREYSDVYRVLPFMLVDGINDAGLVCNVNVVPLEGASTEATVPTGELERSLNSGMLVRFLLDKFDNAHDAAMYVREHCAVTMSKSIADMGYAPHFMLADEQHTYLLEFVDREAVVTCMDDGAGTNVAGNPFMTNFLLHGVALNEDGGVYTPSDVAEDPAHNPETVNGVAADGSGLERYNMLCAAHAASGTVEGMLQTMKDIRYTYAYDLGKGLYTEFAGMEGLTCGSSAEDYLASGVVRLTVDAFNHRSRDPRALTYGTWQTVHTSVYDISNRTMSVYCQEDYDRSVAVRCGGSGESDVKAVLYGEAQSLTSSQKAQARRNIAPDADYSPDWNKIGTAIDGFIINSLMEYEGMLIASTADHGVVKYSPTTGEWTQMGDGIDDRTVHPLEIVNGRLHCGTLDVGVRFYDASTDTWRPIGEILTDSILSLKGVDNAIYAGTFGHGVYKYELGEWTQTGSSDFINFPALSLVLFGGELYVGTGGGYGVRKLADNAWEAVGTGLDGYNALSLVIWDGTLVTGTNSEDGVVRLEGGTWNKFGDNAGDLVGARLMVFGNVLYAATHDGVVRYVQETNLWEQVGTALSGIPTGCLTEYNGGLVAGSSSDSFGGVYAMDNPGLYMLVVEDGVIKYKKAITQSQLAALNSGITAEKVENIDMAVQDVLVDGESVVSGGAAGIPRMSTTVKGVAALGAGLTLTVAGALCVAAAGNSDINARVSPYKPVTPSNLDYSVRSVSPLITALPSDAASPIALTDASATTRNHSWTYTHAPSTAPTYQLPAVSDATIAHEIVLYIDLTSTATFAFQDSAGTTIAVDLNGVTPAVGEKWTVWAEYLHGAWIVRGMKDKEATT